MLIGELLGARRRAKGMSLADVAGQIGMSRSHLLKIETGQVSDPGFAIIVGIARVLDVPLDELASLCTR